MDLELLFVHSNMSLVMNGSVEWIWDSCLSIVISFSILVSPELTMLLNDG